jgi:hypothetical protein
VITSWTQTLDKSVSIMNSMTRGPAAKPGQSRSRSGSYAAVIPLPMRWARAKTWATRSRVEYPNGTALSRMRLLEKQNRG